MNTMLIAFDLSGGGIRYNSFKEIIDRCGSFREAMPSVWILKTNLTPKIVLERLHYHTESRDKVLVIAVTDDFAAHLPIDKVQQICKLICS